MGPLSVEPTTREVIASQLLTELNDKGKVAILATKENLDDLIAAFEDSIGHGPVKDEVRLQWIEDLRSLRTVCDDSL